jgi:hypothetical protein
MTSQAAQLRVHGKIPHVETITRSYAIMVRDGMIARLRNTPFFKNFTFAKSHAIKIMTDKMPYCNVYFMGENLSPDGNANHGEVRFSSEVRIGFSIMMINNDPDAMEDKLDNAYQAILERLLRDPTMYNNSQFKIESFTKGNRVHVYGQVGGVQSNETPYAELRAELFCNLGAIEYEPRVEYMLETVRVETVHPPDAEEGEVQRIVTVYDIDQEEPQL